MPVGSKKTIPVLSSPSVSRRVPVVGRWASRALARIRHVVEPSGRAVRILFMRLPVAARKLSKVVPNIRRTLLFVPCRPWFGTYIYTHIYNMYIYIYICIYMVVVPTAAFAAHVPKASSKPEAPGEAFVQSDLLTRSQVPLQIGAGFFVQNETHHRGKRSCSPASEKDISGNMTYRDASATQHDTSRAVAGNAAQRVTRGDKTSWPPMVAVTRHPFLDSRVLKSSVRTAH